MYVQMNETVYIWLKGLMKKPLFKDETRDERSLREELLGHLEDPITCLPPTAYNPDDDIPF